MCKFLSTKNTKMCCIIYNIWFDNLKKRRYLAYYIYLNRWFISFQLNILKIPEENWTTVCPKERNENVYLDSYESFFCCVCKTYIIVTCISGYLRVRVFGLFLISLWITVCLDCHLYRCDSNVLNVYIMKWLSNCRQKHQTC